MDTETPISGERLNPADMSLDRLSKDLRESGRLLDRAEIRYLVDLYYQLQESRITAGHRERIQGESAEPIALFAHFAKQMHTLENQAKRALQEYAESQPAGVWAMAQRGIGPVIAAGLLGEIDIEQCPSASHVIAFAGIAPGQVWERKTKRPWNARLKVLQFKLGDCIMKARNTKEGVSYYGQIYDEWKATYQQRNDAGVYADRAAWELENKKYNKQTEAFKAYSKGRLPDGRIHSMARRKVAHRFLVHFWWVLWESTQKTPAPRPWIEAHGGHTDIDPPPGW